MAWWSRSGGDSASGEVGVVNVSNWPTTACSFVAMFPLCVAFEWDRVCVFGEVVFSSPVFSKFATGTDGLLAPVPVISLSTAAIVSTLNGEDAMVLIMMLCSNAYVLVAAMHC